MAYHNNHAHIFTMDNAPEQFLSLYMPERAAKALTALTSTDSGTKLAVRILKSLPGSLRPIGKKYARFLQVGRQRTQVDIFRDLLLEYEDSSMVITALTLYMERLGAGASVTGFEGQLEGVITAKRRYPERLLVFFSIDPRWKATGNEILNTVRAYFDQSLNIDAISQPVHPFTGLKLYPSTGFYAFDEKLKPVFQWAADNGVPLLTHCNHLGGIFNNDRNYLLASLEAKNPYDNSYYPAPNPAHKLEKKFFKRLTNTQKLTNNKYYSSYYLEPESFRSMLTWFRDVYKKPLKICFAHYGGDEHMQIQQKLEQDPNMKDPGGYYGIKPGVNWCRQVQDLMLEFPEVYTDISYALTEEKTHDFIFNEMTNKPYRNRILFGTDFYMTEREGREYETYSSFKKRALKTNSTDLNGNPTNTWDMMAGTNVHAFLKSSYLP